VGYDVHITRKENWSDETGPEISQEEWEALADQDPELQVSGSYNGVKVYDWTKFSFPAYPDRPETGFCFCSLHWNPRGEIMTKNPPVEVLQKMHALAQALSARVVGDEDEVYDENGEASVIERGPNADKKASLWQSMISALCAWWCNRK
jgi:hypothetical protein